MSDIMDYSNDDPSDDGGAVSPAAAAANSAGHALPIDRHPDWQVGQLGANGNVLGLFKVADRTSKSPAGDLPAFETHSWRWDDPEAQALDMGAGLAGKAQKGVSALSSMLGLGKMAGGPFSAAVSGVGAYMKHVEEPRLRNEVTALQVRQKQLNGGSKT
jgi:hypothetical protein